MAIRAYQRAIVQLEGEHENSSEEPDPNEIKILAKLYYGVGMGLSELTGEQCAQVTTQLGSSPCRLALWRWSRGGCHVVLAPCLRLYSPLL